MGRPRASPNRVGYLSAADHSHPAKNSQGVINTLEYFHMPFYSGMHIDTARTMLWSD